MLPKTIRSVNLLLAGTLTGNEFGTWAAVHPALEELSPAGRLRPGQALTRRFGAIMPAWMGAALASSFSATLLARGSAGFRATLLGTLCFAAMLASTRLRNVPINERTLGPAAAHTAGAGAAPPRRAARAPGYRTFPSATGRWS